MTLTSLFAARSSRMRASEIRELLKLLDEPGVISFAGGIPDPALFPRDAFRDAYAEALSEANGAASLQYAASEGHPPLRRWIAAEMGRLGVPCDEGNVFITSGSQQGLDYLGKLFLSPGDTALVGWPTYLGALGAFNAYEPRYARLEPGGAAEPYRADAAAAGGAAKFAYLVPDFANPTGTTLTRSERDGVLDLAAELGIAVIEDGAYAALRYDGAPLPPLLALDCARSGGIERARTIYCGSFSKVLAPGVRVGWVCAPRAVVDRLVLIKQAADLHSATLNQVAVHRVAELGYAAQVARCREVYAAKRDGLLRALADHMPTGAAWSRPEGGMFVWVTLAPEVDAAALLRRCVAEARVAFVPGGAFFPDGSGRNSLRLSFTLADARALAAGVPRLAEAIGRERALAA